MDPQRTKRVGLLVDYIMRNVVKRRIQHRELLSMVQRRGVVIHDQDFVKIMDDLEMDKVVEGTRTSRGYSYTYTGPNEKDPFPLHRQKYQALMDWPGITEGRVYEAIDVIESTTAKIKIIDDSGQESWIHRYFFKYV